jgi:mono/diheme cytochrome c family protein
VFAAEIPGNIPLGDPSKNSAVVTVGAIMRLASAFFWLAVAAVTAMAQNAAPASARVSEGKKIFVARCAKCHDDDASKKLPDGSTLLDRLARSKSAKARLATRIKDEDEQRAVAAYVAELLAARR